MKISNQQDLNANSVDINVLRQALKRPDAVAVDVREPDEFSYERIAGSINIPQSRLSAELARLPKDKEIFVFCHTGIRSAQVANALRAQGFPRVRLVEGGLTAWESAGFPMTHSKGPIPIMRQVQIIAGSMALVGVLFPSLRWIAVFVGAGLIFAGVSGFCTMAKLLVFLPWNKSFRNSGSSSGSNCS